MTDARIDPEQDFEGAVEQIARDVADDLRAYLPRNLPPLELARRRLAMAGRHYEWAVRTGVPLLMDRARQQLDLRVQDYVRLLEHDDTRA